MWFFSTLIPVSDFRILSISLKEADDKGNNYSKREGSKTCK